MEPVLPPVGAKVKLNRDSKRWWDVRAADERFAILTRQAAFKPKGEVCYTILDIEEGVRGPCNLIGQSWHLTMPDEACQELLEELQIGAKVQAWNAGDRSFDLDEYLAKKDWRGVEISHRNRVPLDIGEIQRASAAAPTTKEQQPPEHVHTPELRERRHYDPAVIAADAWMCAECEKPCTPVQEQQP